MTEKEEIQTSNVFIETSVFIKENYLAGIKLNAFIKHSEEDKIVLYTNEITLGECLNHIEDEFRNGKNLFKNTISKLSDKAKILKNVKSIKSIFDVEKDFDTEIELQILKDEFEKLIRDNFKFIPVDINSTPKIIDDYFKQNPPFKDGRKKHEFPDAITLNSINTWCKKEKQKIYCLSTDDDFLTFKSKKLIHVKEYDKLLNSISHTYSDANIFNKIENAILKFDKDITSKIEQEFMNELPDDGYDTMNGFEFYIKSVEDVSIEYLSHSVLSFYDNEAVVEIVFKTSYSIEVGYEDLNTGFYDKEDDKYYGVETSSQIVSDDIFITAEIIIHYDLPGKPALWDWNLETITDGLPISIAIE